jgi:hypothetical protein
MSAAENLEFLAKRPGVPDARTAARETLENSAFFDLAKRRVSTFSTGMRLRLGTAQAIVHRPQVLLPDEPTSGLNPMGVRQLRETVLQLNRGLCPGTRPRARRPRTARTAIGAIAIFDAALHRTSCGGSRRLRPDQQPNAAGLRRCSPLPRATGIFACREVDAFGGLFGMPPTTAGPPFDQFLTTAEAVAQAAGGRSRHGS